MRSINFLLTYLLTCTIWHWAAISYPINYFSFFSIFQGTAGRRMLLCIGCTFVVQCERTVVLRSAEMRNFSAAECGKAIRGNLRNVPHLIFRKLPLDNFPQSAFCRIPAPSLYAYTNTRGCPIIRLLFMTFGANGSFAICGNAEFFGCGMQFWIFAEIVYYSWRQEIPRYTGITVFLRRYIIVRHLIPHIPSRTCGQSWAIIRTLTIHMASCVYVIVLTLIITLAHLHVAHPYFALCNSVKLTLLLPSRSATPYTVRS